MNRRLMITLPNAVLEDLEKLSKKKHITKSVLVVLALEKYGVKGESDNNNKKDR